MSSDVAKITLGNETLWERQDPDSTWMEIPDNGSDGDFTGLEFMSWNPETGKAKFLGLRKLVVPFGTPTKDRLLFELPTGYKFYGDNPSSIETTYAHDNYCGPWTLKLSYSDNQIITSFGDPNTTQSGELAIYPHRNTVRSGYMPYTQFDTVFDNTLTFNVIKHCGNKSRRDKSRD